ncbi:splicing regulatory glutamine/lysine-rich protein 1-like isoform X1 [Sycon ciliatum]|uniref:splicing regulatory glutamine/lysine-rich protein 1-like isoform X1 n=1 Tax=Sycon ciliatum TaxID=27933 RepID=UPI0031F6E236
MTLPLGSKLGGGGEVSRTSSGKPITKLRAHPETRFQDSTATNALPSSYYAAKQVSQDSVTSQQQHNRRNPRLATVDERMETAFFPFGRPGCGAPLKTGNGGLRTTLPNVELEDSQREEMLRRRREAQRYRERLNEQTDDRRDKQEPNTISPPSVYDPWGKGIGNVDRDSAGFTRAPPKRHDPYDTALKSDGLSTVANVLKRDSASSDSFPVREQALERQRGREKERDRQTADRQTDRHMGRQTDGWTDRQKDGQTDGQTLEHHERYATLQSMRDAAERSRADRLQNRRTRPVDPPPPSINSDGTPNNTTADWLSGMQVGRAQRDPLTDKVIAGDRKRVQDLFASGSEAPISPRRRTEMEKQELHDHLSEQAEQRQRIKDEARAREKEETAKHMATLDSMFGRPGCGAPLRDDRGRVQAGRQRGNELAVEGYKADTTAVRL